MSELIAPLAALETAGALHPTGLILDSGIGFDCWAAWGSALGKLGDCVRFALGDWLLFGEHHYGEACFEAVPTRLAERTIQQYVWIAERVQPERRRATVPWSLHRLVARFDPAEQVYWLDRAEQNQLSYRDLAAQMEAAVTRVTIEQPAWAEGSPLAPSRAIEPPSADVPRGTPPAPSADAANEIEAAARQVVAFGARRKRGKTYVYEIPEREFESLRAALGEGPLMFEGAQ